MPQGLNVTAVARSMATKSFIDNALSGQTAVQLDSHMGDLHSVNGTLLKNLDSTDVLIVDLDVENQEEMTHLSRIIQQQRGKTAVVVTAADITTHGIRGLIRQGIDDFVPQPLESSDLLEAIDAARLKLRQARSQSDLGKVIVVGRAKGGMGATTIALHTAMALTRKKRRKDPQPRVAFFDFDLHFGDAGMMLDMQANDTFASMLRDPSRLDAELLRQAMTEHKSGLMVLQSPAEAVPLDALGSDMARRMIDLAREEFDYVVIDLPLALPRWLEAVMHAADQLLLVTQLNVPAVRQTRRFIDVVNEEGLFEMPVSVVLNRYVWRFSERGRIKQAIRAIGQPFDHYVPNDYELTLEAVNRGISTFDVRKRAKMNKAIQALAESSVGRLKQNRESAAAKAA
ncbi:MAG: AAA family ATPase [Geminicoccaceae bacterium]